MYALKKEKQKMIKLFKKRWVMLLVIGIVVILGISLMATVGPPDEAPPFWSPGP